MPGTFPTLAKIHIDSLDSDARPGNTISLPELLGGSPYNTAVSACASQNLAPIWLPPASVQSHASEPTGRYDLRWSWTVNPQGSTKATSCRNPARANQFLSQHLESQKASAAPLVKKPYDS